MKNMQNSDGILYICHNSESKIFLTERIEDLKDSNLTTPPPPKKKNSKLWNNIHMRIFDLLIAENIIAFYNRRNWSSIPHRN